MPKGSWKPVTSTGPQGFMLGPILFNICVSDLDGGSVRTFSKFADDPQRGRGLDTPVDCTAVQWDAKRLEIWANKNLLKLSKGKHQVLPLGRKKPQAPTQTG